MVSINAKIHYLLLTVKNEAIFIVSLNKLKNTFAR